MNSITLQDREIPLHKKQRVTLQVVQVKQGTEGWPQRVASEQWQSQNMPGDPEIWSSLSSQSLQTISWCSQSQWDTSHQVIKIWLRVSGSSW